MSNINGKINLLKLPGTAVIKGKAGQSVLCIDLQKAGLFEGQKGVYLDIFMYENKERDQFGNDFSISKAKNKEERAAKTETIYLGNAAKFDGQGVAAENNDAATVADVPADNLPF